MDDGIPSITTIDLGKHSHFTVTRWSLNDAQFEAVARKLCQIRGQNPDVLVAHGAEPDAFGACNAVLYHSPRWQLVAGEVRAFAQMNQAFEEASYGLY